MKCNKCDYSLTRKNIVLATGSINAKLMIIGEAPGYQEDKIGKPFIGKSGILLREMLEHAGFGNPKSTYITNVVKCMPTNGEAPSADSINKCLPYLEEEIKVVKPKMILTLGKVATERFMNNRVATMSELNGTYSMVNKICVFKMYHPSYILRNQNLLKSYKKSFVMLAWVYKNTVNDYHYCDALNKLLNT